MITITLRKKMVTGTESITQHSNKTRCSGPSCFYGDNLRALTLTCQDVAAGYQVIYSLPE